MPFVSGAVSGAVFRRLSLEDQAGDEWSRPLPDQWPVHDMLTALGFLVFGAAGLESYRSLGLIAPDLLDVRAEYAGLAVMSALVAVRRRFPCTAVLVMSVMLIAVDHLVPSIMQILSVQVLCLLLVYSVAAWGRRRSVAAVVLVVAALLIIVRVAWHVLSAASTFPPEPVAGVVPPIVASAAYALMLNVWLIATASAAGWLSWRGARRRELLVRHAGALVAQAAERRDQAVLDERIRIARDLHDVVAHHVAGISIQATAACLTSGTSANDEVTGQLRKIERSAREAVTELGEALKNLRSDALRSHGSGRGLDEIPQLVRECAEKGLTANVGTFESAPGLFDEVPKPVDLSAYRVVQEALANIRRHSTATQAQVTVRAHADNEQRYVEVEIIDRGQKRETTEVSTGLGIVGMRERLIAHGGEGEMGACPGGGYRVRVRFPFIPVGSERVVADLEPELT